MRSRPEKLARKFFLRLWPCRKQFGNIRLEASNHQGNNISFKAHIEYNQRSGGKRLYLTGGCVVPPPLLQHRLLEDRYGGLPAEGSQGTNGARQCCFQVTGTIYITNTQDTMTSSNGTSLSGGIVRGESLQYHGNSG